MKIEKINENKIRCILTRDDLEVRHIKISEIAYGSEKARSLRSSLCMNLLLPDFSYMYYKITRPETVYDFSHRSRFYVLLYHKAGFPTTRNLQDIKRLFPFLFIFCPGFPALLFPPRYVGFQKRNAA